MANQGDYRSSRQGSPHTWQFYKDRRHDPKWSEAYKILKHRRAVHFVVKVTALFILFVAVLFLSAYIQVPLYNSQGVVVGQTSIFNSCVSLVTHFLNQLSALH